MKSFFIFVTTCALSTGAFGFGIDGSDGRSGNSGAPGIAGQDIIVEADGSGQVFYLNGTNGKPGENGENGSSAYSCSYSEGHSNEYGADGGDGGRGGNGGNGGRGGDALIFYTDLSDLKNITIESQGGYGAPGGYGASPGYGCQCSSYSWSRESCSTTETCSASRVCRDTGTTRTGPDGRTAPARICHDRRVCTPSTTCSTSTYYCHSGSTGSQGSDGSHGDDGRWGQISLVKDLEELPGHNPRGTLGLVALSQEDVLLSRRIWTQKTGAKKLFAPESLIQDGYREFVKLAEAKFRLVWEAQAPVENFKETKFDLSFDGKKITFKVHGEDFLKYETMQVGEILVVTVTEAFKKSELTQLKVEGTKGHGENLVITVNDAAGLSHLVQNKVKLQFVHKSWFSWYVVYDELVPASALTIGPEGMKIHVGKLDILYKAIKRKKKVRFTVTIERSFGNNQTQVEEFFGPVKLY